MPLAATNWDRADGTSRPDDGPDNEIINLSGTGFIYSSGDDGASWVREYVVIPRRDPQGFVRCSAIISCGEFLYVSCGNNWFSSSGGGNWGEANRPACERIPSQTVVESRAYRFEVWGNEVWLITGEKTSGVGGEDPNN
jgi:hypothetical protein